jgi:hypothetical protein
VDYETLPEIGRMKQESKKDCGSKLDGSPSLGQDELRYCGQVKFLVEVTGTVLGAHIIGASSSPALYVALAATVAGLFLFILELNPGEMIAETTLCSSSSTVRVEEISTFCT